MKTEQLTHGKTHVSRSMPWGLYSRNGHRVLCSDGIIRAVEMSETADSFFSVPARLRIKGKWITGYVTTEESIDRSDWSSHVAWSFRQHDGQDTTLPDWSMDDATKLAFVSAAGEKLPN